MNFFKTLIAAFLGVFLAAFMLLMIGFFFLVGLVSSAQETKVATVAQNSVLKLDLGRALQERAEPDAFAGWLGGGSPLGLNQVIASIREAKDDDRIKGIYLRSGWFGGGQASAEAIRKSLLEFRKSGKFIYAYSEYYTETAYYVATAADSIFLYPEGLMEWNGLASTPMYVRGAFDKLGIEPRIFKVGTYKSATEMFSETKMSEPAREQTTVLLNDLWSHMLQGIGQRRNIPAEQLRGLANTLAITSAASAQNARLVDALLDESQVRRLLKHRAGEDNTKRSAWAVPADSSASEDDYEVKFADPAEYAEASRANISTQKNTIAVIYAEGEIGMGSGGNTSIGHQGMVDAIRKARLDDDVKAIVLRINSPGGSSLASDIIWREVKAARASKPVIASFGDVAASGGYYIAAGADQIVAEPNTITGSIGIFAVLANTKALFQDKLGITFDRVTTNQYSDFANPNRQMSDLEAAVLQRNVNEGYGDFIRVVQQGRKFSDSTGVDKIAQGRVWSGVRARQLGLVDTLGGIDVALKIAAEKAGLGDDYKLRTFPEYRSALEELRSGFDVKMKTWLASQFLTPEQREVHTLMERFNDPKHTYALMPQSLVIK